MDARAQPAPAGPSTPDDSPLTMADVLASPRHRRLMSPTVAEGEPAVPFRLPLLDPRAGGPWGADADLGRLLGRRPVALVFGSYT
jgi:hypothetical protein